MFCSNCGRKVPNKERKFCDICGCELFNPNNNPDESKNENVEPDAQDSKVLSPEPVIEPKLDDIPATPHVENVPEDSSRKVQSVQPTTPSRKTQSLTIELPTQYDLKTIIPNLITIICFFIPILSLKGHYSVLADIAYSEFGSKMSLSLNNFTNMLYKAGNMIDSPGLQLSILMYVVPLMSALVIFSSYTNHKKTDSLNLYSAMLSATVGLVVLVLTLTEQLKDYIGVNFVFILFIGATAYTLYRLLSGVYEKVAHYVVITLFFAPFIICRLLLESIERLV